MKKTAGNLFNGKEKYNCAQALSKAFQSVFHISDETIKAYKIMGKGKAEGGICGSVFAARQMLKNPDNIKKFEEHFIETAGSLKCKEIKKHKKIDCRGTVILAEDLIQSLQTHFESKP